MAARGYNDACVAFLGTKHPAGLGQPTRARWPEVWHLNAPIYERVRTGERDLPGAQTHGDRACPCLGGRDTFRDAFRALGSRALETDP